MTDDDSDGEYNGVSDGDMMAVTVIVMVTMTVT